MTTPSTPPEFEALLDYLKRTRGFDFTAYKRASLMRRIQKRMQTLGTEDYNDYVDYLEVHPEEFTFLFNTILINVTSFFRDSAHWDYLAAEILPRILAGKTPSDSIRVWSAGCASGQEAYTLAMLLAEPLGEEEFRRQVKIYATDVDEEALNEARQGSYSQHQVEDVPPQYLDKYFDHSNGRYNFHKELRRSVIFGRHDLIQDAPISRVDLLVCRNTLMYFNAEAQSKILSRFDFALNGGGFLFLGKAEVLLTRSQAFAPVDLKRRVFATVPKPRPRDRNRLPENSAEEALGLLVDSTRVHEAALETDPVPHIIVDRNGTLTFANEQARLLFGLTLANVGRSLQDLQISFRPVELRSLIEQVTLDRLSRTVRDTEWVTASGEKHWLDVLVLPLFERSGNPLGVKILFTDVTRYKRLQEQLQQSRQELETTNEELETTNEELQSTVEELETTNEELQSTNEELETMNEELQSTNEELETINEELRQRSDELNGATAFFSSILTSLRDGVVVGRNQQVLAWNHRAEDLWGLRAEEVRGKSFLSLDIGLPVEQLKNSIRACLAGETDYQEVTLDATNRRGKAIQVKVACSRLSGLSNTIQGVILVMEEKRNGQEG